MEYNELMQGFADAFGVKEMEIEDGVTALDIDGTVVAFLHEDNTDAVILAAEIGTPPPDADGHFVMTVLQANFLYRSTDGATIAINPENGAYVIQRSEPLGSLDVASLSSKVEALVNAAENWRQILHGFQEAEQALEEQDASMPSLPQDFSQSGFLQV